jgi:predicted dehydrogenase
MADKVRWGFMSTAKIGKKLIEGINLGDTSVVSAVASRDLERAQGFAKDHGFPHAYGSYEELLTCGEIDAIYNPLPNSLHAEWTIKALEAGIPVLCEKPLASDAAEAQTMVDAAKRTGVLFAEAFMYRFHPVYEKVFELIESGAIGKIVSIKSTFCFYLANRSNIRARADVAGGSTMDVGCYCINLARRMAGCEPARAQAFERRTTVDDTLLGTLEFPNGILAQFECSIENQLRKRAEIAGTEGAIVLPDPWFPGDDAAEVILINDDGEERIPTAGANCYQLEVDDFVRVMRGDGPLRWEPSDGVANMAVIDALYESAREGRAVEVRTW